MRSTLRTTCLVSRGRIVSPLPQPGIAHIIPHDQLRGRLVIGPAISTIAPEATRARGATFTTLGTAKKTGGRTSPQISHLPAKAASGHRVDIARCIVRSVSRDDPDLLELIGFRTMSAVNRKQ